MSNLPKQILNYFATFTETRFNFRRLINYKWTNNELTLDLSFFPEFQLLLLKKIKDGDLSPLLIKQNKYTIVLNKDTFLVEIKKLLQDYFNTSYLEKCILAEYNQIAADNTIFIVGENGELRLSQDTEDEEDLLAQQKDMAQKEGLRTYNLALRRQFEKTLNNLQDKIVEQRKVELNIEHAPSSIFGVRNYVTQQFEQLNRIGNNFSGSEKYITEVSKYFSNAIDDIVIYDLYYNFQKYSDFAKLGTLFVFFHMLERGKEAYPLYFIEVEYRTSNSEVTLSFPRDLMLLNAPAVNYFKFDNVLTVPRASSITTTKGHLGAMETFIQAQYGFQTPFILEPFFARITHANENFPQIKNRIGLQIVTNEDKKLLDYSELMTKMELGESSKFSEFIDQYIKGTVPNHQEEVDKVFLEKYSRRSPERYVSDSPIPVNNPQKRILLALANEKNNIIVVDGPPGTGKSHTIAALTYWANENNKSVVITSHKQEALDVIDRMLTDKYKSLHALEYNKEATEIDEKKLGTKLIEAIEKKLEQSGKYEEIIRRTIEFDCVDRELATDATIANITSTIVMPKQKIDFEKITAYMASGTLQKLLHTSLEEYAYLIEQKDKIPDFLEACEKLHQIPEDAQHIETSLADIPSNFPELVANLKTHFKHDIKISEITKKHTTTGWINKIFGKAPKEEDIKLMLAQLSSLKYAGVVKEVAKILNIKKENVTIANLLSGADKIRFALSMRKHQALLASYRALPGNQNKGISEVYEIIRKYSETNDLLNDDVYQALNSLFKNYGTLLNHFGITETSLDTLTKLIGHDVQVKNSWQWIQLHYFLSENASDSSISLQDIQTYYKLKQKDIEHLNDNRLKNLNNHLGTMARIKVSYKGGKRFTIEEAKVLLNSISCIIAEPSTISKHFPMEEGLIDVYSESYFSEIITAYADDYSTTVSEAAKKELVDEVSKEVPADEQESDILLKPQDGTVLWLKTFNIRTSTLTFAKAIANYNTALKEHFRSFPEIISYSNDFFYKEANMELIVNRIRTKPIGEVLQFMPVTTQGKAGPNTNLDEIEAIANDIQKRLDNGFKGTIGVIASFKEQQARLEQTFNEKFNMAILKRNHKLAIWFVGDVQGEERDIVYYSIVEDKSLQNANLASIYPVIGGTADSIRSLKMQRLNVGFSRAKDTMIFVHSQPIEHFSNTRLGYALKHYQRILEINKQNDFFIEDESIFESPMEKKLYRLLLETKFVKNRREHIKIIPQFDIGKYIAAEHRVYIPKYRTDFLLTYAEGGKDQTLILEYDGVEYHFKNPHEVNSLNFSQGYLDYDTARQLELEIYGYRFLRINKFNLRPKTKEQTEADVLNALLEGKFQNYAQN
jgi:hypothetical protein